MIYFVKNIYFYLILLEYIFDLELILVVNKMEV
jgi:hypothetical protein